MKVVSNTSPICYLYLINQIEILPSLFEEVHIPNAVYDELRDKNAPLELRRWIEEYPTWLNIHSVTIPSDSYLVRLHPGEREAICLAQDKIKSIDSIDNLRTLTRKVYKTQSLEEFTELVNQAAQN